MNTDVNSDRLNDFIRAVEEDDGTVLQVARDFGDDLHILWRDSEHIPDDARGGGFNTTVLLVEGDFVDRRTNMDYPEAMRTWTQSIMTEVLCTVDSVDVIERTVKKLSTIQAD